MKVRELIEELKKFDPELTVIKQKDDEGNGYHPVNLVTDDAWVSNDDLHEWWIDFVPSTSVIEEDDDLDFEDFTTVVVIC